MLLLQPRLRSDQQKMGILMETPASPDPSHSAS